MEFIEKLGVDRGTLEQVMPMLIGGLGALVALVVGRFGIRAGVRGTKAVYAWYTKPPVPPTLGTQEWIVAELIKLMTPENDHKWRTCNSDFHRYETTLSNGTTVVMRYLGTSVELSIQEGGKPPTLVECLHDRKLNRAAKYLQARTDVNAKAAKTFKVNTVLAAALQHEADPKPTAIVTVDKPTDKPNEQNSGYVWELRMTRAGDLVESGYVIKLPDLESPAKVAANAYNVMMRQSAGSVIRAELVRFRVSDPGKLTTIAYWAWEPAVKTMCLLTTTMPDIPGLVGPTDRWATGSLSPGQVPQCKTAYLAYEQARRSHSGGSTVNVPVYHYNTENGAMSLVGHVMVI